MNSVLPHTTNRKKMGLDNMVLVAHNNPGATGPTVSARKPRRVPQGILQGWSVESANAYVATPKPLDTWDYSWTETESYWENNVAGCRTPEEVEALLPTKWLGYRVDKEVDDSLVKVCRMCTALVDRFVAMVSGKADANTAAKWREQQLLKLRLRAITELLEASIGDAIPVLRLRDPAYVGECWKQLEDDERQSVMAALNGAEDESFLEQEGLDAGSFIDDSSEGASSSGRQQHQQRQQPRAGNQQQQQQHRYAAGTAAFGVSEFPDENEMDSSLAEQQAEMRSASAASSNRSKKRQLRY